MLLPTFTVYLFQVNTKRHAWKFVSYVILDPVRLAIDVNHHVSDAFRKHIDEDFINQ